MINLKVLMAREVRKQRLFNRVAFGTLAAAFLGIAANGYYTGQNDAQDLRDNLETARQSHRATCVASIAASQAAQDSLTGNIVLNVQDTEVETCMTQSVEKEIQNSERNGLIISILVALLSLPCFAGAVYPLSKEQEQAISKKAARDYWQNRPS